MGFRAALLAVAGIIVVLLVGAGFLYGLRSGRADLDNGSFENGQFVNASIAQCDEHMRLDSGNTANIDGWTVSGSGTVVWWRHAVNPSCNLRPAHGTFFVDMGMGANPNPPGGPIIAEMRTSLRVHRAG